MIKFTTPIGPETKETMKEALEHCKEQAKTESLKTTGIYTSITSSEYIHISCNEKKWIIPLART